MNGLTPSSAHRWSKCLGYVEAVKDVPYEKMSKHAREGTDTHNLLYTSLAFGVSPITFNGKELSYIDKAIGYDYTVNTEQASRALIAFNYIIENCNIQQLSLEKEIEINGMSGRIDISYIKDGVLTVIDYKDGYQLVDAHYNKQLMLYAKGVAEASFEEINEVVLTIIQPKASEITSYHKLSIDELNKQVHILFNTMVRIRSGDTTRTSGEHCRYCPVKSDCPEVIKKVKKVLKVDDITDVKNMIDGKADGFTDDEKVMLLKHYDIISAIVANIKDELKTRLKAGENISGVSLGIGRVNKVWNISNDQLYKLFTKIGIPKSFQETRKILSPSQCLNVKYQKRGEEDIRELTDSQKKIVGAYIVDNTSGATLKLNDLGYEERAEKAVNYFSPIK